MNRQRIFLWLMSPLFFLSCLHSEQEYSFDVIDDLTDQKLSEIVQRIHDRHGYEKAYVRTGIGLCSQELTALKNRLRICKAGVESLVNFPVSYSHLPNISLFCSGGGYRSMIASLGFLIGSRKIGLLDTLWYISTLSGSTWMLAGWLAQNMPLHYYRDFMKKAVETHALKTTISLSALAEILLRKLMTKNKITLVDFWGAVIGNVLFRNLSPAGKDVFLSDVGSTVADGSYPLPIFTSIVETPTHGYEWFEYTPFEIGCTSFKSFIPCYSFGSYFNQGISSEITPEFTFGNLLGIFGAAFSVSMRDLLRICRDKINHPKLVAALDKILDAIKIGNLRITKGHVTNFMLKMPQKLMSDKKHLDLMDAGIDFNLPLPPLLSRGVDIYIACDASNPIEKGNALQLAVEYARKHGIKFPKIDYSILEDREISVFWDQDPLVPIVIYIPNKRAYSTLKLDYDHEEFEDLCGFMENTLIKNKNIFVDVIKKKMSQLKNAIT